MLARALGPICAVLLAACSSGVRPTGPTPTSPTGDQDDPEVAVPLPDRDQVPVRPGPAGAPHYGAIVMSAVARTGDAALSLDRLGDLRLWTALDGSTPPRAVPVAGVAGMWIEAGGDQLLAGLADESGTGYLLRYRRDGTRLGAATVPSGNAPVIAVIPLGDASAAVVLRGDQGLERVDLDGTTTARLAARGARVMSLAAGDGTSLVALVRRADDPRPSYVVQRLRVTPTAIEVTGEAALTVAPHVPAMVGVSLDGRRLAYFHDPGAGPPPAAEPVARGRGRRAPRRPPPPPTDPVRVTVVEVATGRAVTPPDLADLPISGPTGIGFTGDKRLHVFAGGNDWTAELDAGTVIPGSGLQGRPATGRDLIVAGEDRLLVTRKPAGEVRYLGYAAMYPQVVALSDDGKRAAWIASPGHVVIETLDGSAPDVIGPSYDSGAGFVRFIGDDRVLVATQRGRLELLDAASGEVMAAAPFTGAATQIDYEPASGWLVGVLPQGGAWAIAVDPSAARPLSAPMIVPDGSTLAAALTPAGPDDPVLITVDANPDVRRYTAAELRAGISPSVLRAKPTVRLPMVPFRFDGRGRWYAIESGKVTIHDDTTQLRELQPGGNVAGALVARDASMVAVPDGQGTVTGYAADGTRRWGAAVGPNPGQSWSYSADGRRLAVVSSGGGVVLDTATGEVVAARCAWNFAAWSAPPPGFSTSVRPVCQ